MCPGVCAAAPDHSPVAGPWVARGAYIHRWQGVAGGIRHRRRGSPLLVMSCQPCPPPVKAPLQLGALLMCEEALRVHHKGTRAPWVAGQKLQEAQEACMTTAQGDPGIDASCVRASINTSRPGAAGIAEGLGLAHVAMAQGDNSGWLWHKVQHSCLYTVHYSRSSAKIRYTDAGRSSHILQVSWSFSLCAHACSWCPTCGA